MPHLAPRRQFLQQWSRELAVVRPELRAALEPFITSRSAVAASPATFEDYRKHLAAQESYSVEDEGGKDKASYYAKTRLIERVVIKNFKALRDLELTFPPAGDKGPCFVLLGENGTGKSSILKAVALALMGREHHRRLPGLDASSYVTLGETSGHVHVYLTGVPDPVELTFRRGEREFGLKPENPKVLLLGYGATRLLPRPGTTPVDNFGASKADNLFSPFVPLDDANAWLVRQGKTERKRMAEGLKKLLLLGEKADLAVAPGPPPTTTVELHGERIPLADLSDGYQGMAALAADIMSVMEQRWPDMDLAEGIVLIDEIDAHLHPRWKMQVVERLRAVFPRLQFVMTTHDPLCLLGLKAEEVAVMRRDTGNLVRVLRDLPSPTGLRVDQILTSDLFGLNSTRSPEDDRLFEEYYRLLATRERTEEEEKELARLKARLADRDLMGKDQRERLMLEAADHFLARSRQELDTGLRSELKEETKKKMAELKENTKQTIADLWATVVPAESGR